MRELSAFDRLLVTSQVALSTLSGATEAARPYPPVARGVADVPLDVAQRAEAAALMRVNHVGEICAQALYEAQALATPNPRLRAEFRSAAIEETDHLAWTRRRIQDLGGRTSLLSPLWFAGAFSIGLLAGRLGDRASLGFMAETERQVEQHLAGHLQRLPAGDAASRAIVEQMKDDEARHGQAARALGGAELPRPVRAAMRLAAKVMTTTAHVV
ncbi:MAG TPA: 2-polyprenyl-3-methyl-6-methoxy-1,4-benzoquinone monooxygenase [Burkholderiaceae bacterium]|nr:2-polyprenyl-3-methyl-6-methoxy-1,4-benzoquinone monooxygenase [Burkholderiaceae bacterium]